MNGIWVEDVQRNYREGLYTNQMEYPNSRKYKENHIFDENESVKWNRKKVIEENEKIEKQREIYGAHTEELNEKFRDDCISALINQFKLNGKQAEIIYGYVYREYHSSIHDMCIYLEEIGSVIVDVIKNS